MDDNKFAGAGSSLSTSEFGSLSDGSKVMRYLLANGNGILMEVIDFGATITSLKIPIDDKHVDVVLGFDKLDDYINAATLPAPPHFGAAIGRYAGRIKDGRFKINGKQYQLNANNGPNTLHGGIKGFDKVLWNVQSVSGRSIELGYLSPDGDEHFPGDLQVVVRYTLTDQNEIIVEYEAISSQDTIVNLTQHSYFNLDGHDGDVTAQLLKINSDTILEIDTANIPSGRLIDAASKGFDFTVERNVPDQIDDSFVIADITKPAATLRSTENGLQLTVFSDQPSLHIYVGGNLFGKFKGKHESDYHRHSGICFESQNYPDAPNQPHFPNSILRKGERYSQKTVWKFDWPNNS